MATDRHHRLAAWLVIFALIAKVLLPTLCHPAPASNDVSNLLGPLVICTAHGAETRPDAPTPPGERSQDEHCPACALLKTFALAILLIAAALSFRCSSHLARPWRVHNAPPSHLLSGRVRSRAPPQPA